MRAYLPQHEQNAVASGMGVEPSGCRSQTADVAAAVIGWKHRLPEVHATRNGPAASRGSALGDGRCLTEGLRMLVECWLWRYRDPLTGEVRTTQRPMSAEEVAAFLEAKRIRGTRTHRFEDEESPETIPAVFRTAPE